MKSLLKSSRSFALVPHAKHRREKAAKPEIKFPENFQKYEFNLEIMMPLWLRMEIADKIMMPELGNRLERRKAIIKSPCHASLFGSCLASRELANFCAMPNMGMALPRQ
jgi:hypothetical protein